MAYSCMPDGGRDTSHTSEEMVQRVDSVLDEFDTLAYSDTLVLVDDVIPLAADESFSDFFFNFMTDDEYQSERILFPISYYESDSVMRVAKDDWVFDPIFSANESYTVLFDKAEDMELERDTSITSVQVDWIYLDSVSFKRYYFEKKAERWMLEAINKGKLKTKESQEDFYTFFNQFAVDSVFQRERLNNPLLFVTTDPEDDFNILETILEDGQWFAFRPPMMQHRLTNIRYGQKESMNSNAKIVEFKGVGNGLSNVLYFRRIGGKWTLTKFEDLSD